MADPNTREKSQITVRLRGMEYAGWLQSEVDRNLETLAGRFSIPITLVPGQEPPVKRQDSVQILIGGQVVITGYVVAAEPFYGRNDCGLQIVGRDRTGDLVRCSAIHKGGQWREATLDRIARDLVAPFGLEVKVATNVGKPLTDFKLNHGESVLDALARAARLCGVLVTRDNAGRVLLTRAGSGRAPGAIRRAVNVISMQGIGSDEHRHSEYIAYGQANMADDFDSARQVKARAKDAEIPRYMPLIINADGNVTQAELQTLVDHTARVRRGQAMGFRYVVEGWTVNGQPWEVNTRVAVWDDVAGLAGDEWLISSARATCDLKEGDVTELVVRPIEAYDTVPLRTKVRHRKADRKGDGVRLIWPK